MTKNDFQSGTKGQKLKNNDFFSALEKILRIEKFFKKICAEFYLERKHVQTSKTFFVPPYNLSQL